MPAGYTGGNAFRTQKRERNYSVSKKKLKKKTKKGNFADRMNHIFGQIHSDSTKSEFIKHILDNVAQKMSRDTMLKSCLSFPLKCHETYCYVYSIDHVEPVN